MPETPHCCLVAYALDRLGWLQFEQFCGRLLELEAGIPRTAWSGGADRCRCVLSGTPIGAPLLATPLPEPVLVQCAWLHPQSPPAISPPDRLMRDRPDDVGLAWSYLLLTNAVLAPSALPGELIGRPVAVLGPEELSARIGAGPVLRLEMPSLLGIGPIDQLIDAEVDRRSSLDRRAAEALAAVFVPTRAYEQALTVLRTHRFTVLTGPPEMGKTAIARMIALAQLTGGWEAHECTNPDDVWAVFDPERAQVFIADDAFGSTEYRADAAERWAVSMERLLRSLDDRHWLIWTSRPAPLHAALRRLHRERGAEHFPSPARVLVDAGDLDIAEKTLILFRHAKAAGLSPPARRGLRELGSTIVAEPHFTPERIRRLVARVRTGEADVARAAATELTTPTEAMATSFAALSREHRDLLVALLDTPPGPVSERDLVAALRRHHDGPLSRAPVEIVDRLADHFLRVLT